MQSAAQHILFRFLVPLVFLTGGTLCIAKPLAILLAPSGDSAHPGRKIVESYERGLTLQCAEKLAARLKKNKNFSPIITRKPGELVPELQNASFSNRLGADFFVSISMFYQKDVKPIVHVLYNVIDPLADKASNNVDPLCLIPLHKAHVQSLPQSTCLATGIVDYLMTPPISRRCECRGPYALPYKPLYGVLAPAIGIEIGLSQEESVNSLIEPLAESIEKVLAAK